ncbi:hypothetical protein DPMN_061997 [Dreissena polymorpha]|uniref:Uncharacterized protein n=1 Tax=Dreissena polymorpha TaxID=45954 RepID=A0A9D4HHE0_DREPO|nr:hypothetical protein DPMN_061997 [Dreissena polymorpha]
MGTDWIVNYGVREYNFTGRNNGSLTGKSTLALENTMLQVRDDMGSSVTDWIVNFRVREYNVTGRSHGSLTG